ncbi:MAG: beta-ketoacyl-ACP reductase [Chitinophagales bacterium]|nr:MAG: beta-ketoacyl-ACP reductase [Chitinophagales bacterium]
MQLLAGKIALITGGSRGIGEAITQKFAMHGAQVAFTYKHSADRAQALEAKLSQAGIRCKSYCSDASDFSASERLVESVLHDFGRIDILVNNAGITRDALLLRMTEVQWDEVIHNNLKSVFNLTRFVSWHMLKQKSGAIINITSIIGLIGNPGQANYASAKAGIIAFTKTISQELGSRKIRCNAIAPGFIDTEMTRALDEKTAHAMLQKIPMGRLGTAEEVANTALFLASDLSSYINGQVISVCGGMYR